MFYVIFSFQCCDKLNQSVVLVDVSSDIRNIAKQRGSLANTPEQILIDCYVSSCFVVFQTKKGGG